MFGFFPFIHFNLFNLFHHEVVDCGNAPSLSSGIGTMNITSTTYKGEVTYTCTENSTLVGIQKRVCQADGKWSQSGSSSKCQIKTDDGMRLGNCI